MTELSPKKIAGENLRLLINHNYPNQAEFAYEFGAVEKTISRYVNDGINKLDTIQELAHFFGVEYIDFFKPIEKDL